MDEEQAPLCMLLPLAAGKSVSTKFSINETYLQGGVNDAYIRVAIVVENVDLEGHSGSAKCGKSLRLH